MFGWKFVNIVGVQFFNIYFLLACYYSLVLGFYCCSLFGNFQKEVSSLTISFSCFSQYFLFCGFKSWWQIVEKHPCFSLKIQQNEQNLSSKFFWRKTCLAKLEGHMIVFVCTQHYGAKRTKKIGLYQCEIVKPAVVAEWSKQHKSWS